MGGAGGWRRRPCCCCHVQGWQCWTAVGIGGGHAQRETGGGGGHGDCGDAGMLDEVSGANTATSTLVHVSTIFKTNAPFLVSSNFIHPCLLAV